MPRRATAVELTLTGQFSDRLRRLARGSPSGAPREERAADLTARLLRFCRLDRRARIALRNQVEAHSTAFDWSRLASAYHEAHDLALANPQAQRRAKTSLDG